MQISLKIGPYHVMLQIRTSTKTREFDAPKIDHAKKQAVIDSLNLDELAQKAAAMKARRALAQG